MTLEREDVFGGREFLPKLVEELEAMYPHVDPQPSDDWARVLYRSGQHSVVKYLKSKLQED